MPALQAFVSRWILVSHLRTSKRGRCHLLPLKLCRNLTGGIWKRKIIKLGFTLSSLFLLFRETSTLIEINTYWILNKRLGKTHNELLKDVLKDLLILQVDKLYRWRYKIRIGYKCHTCSTLGTQRGDPHRPARKGVHGRLGNGRYNKGTSTLTHCILDNFHAFLTSADFSKSIFQKNFF